MSYYVEFLRAVREFRVAAIVMGVVLLIACIARLAVHEQAPSKVFGELMDSPTAHVSRTTLADGSVRTVVNDPVKRVHAVATIHGYHWHIDLVQPAHGAPNTERVNAGAFSMSDVTRKNGTEHVVIDSSGIPPLPLGLLFLTSILPGFIMASRLGGVLAKENDGHLEIAWTKPVSRERYAAAAFAVDIATIVATQFVWLIMVMLILLAYFVSGFYLESGIGVHVGLALLGPIAWYAALNGWSASLKRGPGMVVGLGWLFAIIVPAIASGTASLVHPLAGLVHAVFTGLTYLDPIAFCGISVRGSVVSASVPAVGNISLAASCAVLAALAIFYLAASLVQWRRVEA